MAAKIKPRATESANWERVDAINRQHEYDAQDDGFTLAEYAERYKLPRATAEGRLNRLVAAGALARGFRYVRTSAGFRKLRVFSLPTKARRVGA